MFKEIHAYRNEDGTYRIEMRSDVTYGTTELWGCLVGETSQSITEVPRAQIHINALSSNGVIASLILGDTNNETR